MHIAAATRIASELCIPDLLLIAGPNGLHVKEIAAKTNTAPFMIGAFWLRYLWRIDLITLIIPSSPHPPSLGHPLRVQGGTYRTFNSFVFVLIG
jgi:hypothetical protein